MTYKVGDFVAWAAGRPMGPSCGRVTGLRDGMLHVLEGPNTVHVPVAEATLLVPREAPLQRPVLNDYVIRRGREMGKGQYYSGHGGQAWCVTRARAARYDLAGAQRVADVLRKVGGEVVRVVSVVRTLRLRRAVERVIKSSDPSTWPTGAFVYRDGRPVIHGGKSDFSDPIWNNKTYVLLAELGMNG